MSEKEIICVSNEVNKLRGKLEKELEEEKIQKVKDFCYRYLSLNLEDFDSRKLLEKILEILGDKECIK